MGLCLMIGKSDYEELFGCLEVEEHVSYADAIEANLYIPESNSFYSLYRTPFFRFILERLEDRDTRVIGIMVASQVGKTVLLVALALEWMARNPSSNVLYYTPDQSTANMIASDKLLPPVTTSPYYANLLKKNDNDTINRSSLGKNKVKYVNGSSITVQTAGGKMSLVGRSSPLVLLDEFGKMKSLAKNISGDVLALAETRTTAFAKSNRKIIAAGSPDLEGETIAKLHSEAKQYAYYFDCPHCNHEQTLDFNFLQWDKPDKEVSNVYFANMLKSGKLSTYYVCPSCQGRIEEKQKNILLNKGRMKCVGNEDLSEDKISIHINGLYGVASWGEIASKYILSQDDSEIYKEFVQQVLAAPYQENEKTKKIKLESIGRSGLPKGKIPDNTYKILGGVDVQANRLYYVLAAFTTNKEIVVFDWGEPSFDIEGNPLNRQSFPYEVLDRMYDGHEVEMLLIDAGFNTKNVIDLCLDLPRAQAIKGFNKAKFSKQYAFRSKDPNLLMIPIQDTNELLESYIKSKTILFPDDIDDSNEIFHHLTNVIRQDGKYQDRKKGVRTDLRDSLRYLTAFGEYCDYFGEIDYRHEDSDKAITNLAQTFANAFRLN